MNRFLFSLLLFVYSLSTGFCQNRNNIWQLGAQYKYDAGMGIDFSFGRADTFSLNRIMSFFITDAGICDTTGKLLFCTNGVYVDNSKNDTLLNSDDFNPGYGTSFQQSQFDGLNIGQGTLIIPYPRSDSLYYLFHESWDTFYFQRINLEDEGTLHLAYSIINMRGDAGLGQVEPDKKDKIILNDTLVKGRLTACKHANGRDWWLITHKSFSTLYYKFLITPLEITGPDTQSIGSHVNYDANGQSCFSPDGSHFAMMNYTGDTLDIFNFDRCSGEFSTLAEVPIIDTIYTGGNQGFLLDIGCAFSPNSRFLYANNSLNIYQIDLNSSDIIGSKTLIATWDTSGKQYEFFYTEQLGPDGKIYLSQTESGNTISVIEKPDSLGKAADLVQGGFTLPYPNIFCFPNSLNYDIGALVGSPCDTSTGIQFFPEKFSLSIYPNPVSQWLKIKYQSSENLQCTLSDVTGRLIAHFTLYPYFKSRLFDMDNLPAGIYILSTKNENGDRISRKIVKE